MFGTTDDGNAATPGDQTTAIEYRDGLDFIPDLNADIASFSLTSLRDTGPALAVGPAVIQNFVGGTFNLFDSANVLLFQGALGTSALTWTLGPPGSVFTTGPALVTGGTLAPLIVPGSLSLSLTLKNITDGGAGPIVDGGALLFTADSTVAIAAKAVSEPTVFGLFTFGALVAIGLCLRRL